MIKNIAGDLNFLNVLSSHDKYKIAINASAKAVGTRREVGNSIAKIEIIYD